jgi:hypothetical protein
MVHTHGHTPLNHLLLDPFYGSSTTSADLDPLPSAYSSWLLVSWSIMATLSQDIRGLPASMVVSSNLTGPGWGCRKVVAGRGGRRWRLKTASRLPPHGMKGGRRKRHGRGTHEGIKHGQNIFIIDFKR